MQKNNLTNKIIMNFIWTHSNFTSKVPGVTNNIIKEVQSKSK